MLALLDFDKFHDLLLDATRDLLVHVKEEYSDRQLYAFYLFHDPLWGFVVPRLSVEGGIKPFPKLGYIVKQAINLALRSASPQPQIQTNQHPHDFNVAHRIGREYFEDVNMWLLRAQFYRVTFTHKQMASIIGRYQRSRWMCCRHWISAGYLVMMTSVNIYWSIW